MSTVDGLIRAYQAELARPWETNLAPAQRVWLLMYAPHLERRMRSRVYEFKLLTQQEGHPWQELDLTNTFAEWMANLEYRDAYFEQPESMEYQLQNFREHVAQVVRTALGANHVGSDTVVALLGTASLFGLIRLSDVLEDVATAVRGRLLVFFPGQRDGNNYRLMDARDGWNYLARPIEATD